APASQRAHLLGLLGAAFGVGFVAGPAIGALAALGGPHIPFFIAAAIAAVNAVVASRRLPETRSWHASGRATATGVPKTRGVGAHERGGLLGVHQAVGGLARIVGPLAAGFAFGRIGVPAPYAAGAALMLGAVVILVLPRGNIAGWLTSPSS